MVQFIESGFWYAVLAVVVTGIASSIISIIFHFMLRNICKSTVLGFIKTIIGYLPSVLMFLYIWQIRDGIGWLIFGILGVLSFLGAMFGVFRKITDKSLSVEVSAWPIQLKLPVAVNDEMRLDSITVLPGLKILQTYTLVKVEAGETFSADMIPTMRDNLLKSIKSDATLARYRENGITFVYRYMDKDKLGQVGIFEFTPSDYK